MDLRQFMANIWVPVEDEDEIDYIEDSGIEVLEVRESEYGMDVLIHCEDLPEFRSLTELSCKGI